MALVEARLRDASGEGRAVWFGRPYLARQLAPGRRGFFTGSVTNRKGVVLSNPEFELLEGEDAEPPGRIVPAYPLTEGLTQRLVRRLVEQVLARFNGDLPDPLPAALRQRHGLPPLGPAFRAVHTPEDVDAAHAARRRFAYQELLARQLGVLLARRDMLAAPDACRHVVDGPHLRALEARLPFTLTGGQRRAVDEILGDMAAPHPMTRLLQGDVGCGKTAVALHAIAAACDGRYQVAVMAPTEILAEQHTLRLRPLLAPLGIQTVLITASAQAARHARELLQGGHAHVAVGTQALLSETTLFRRLGLVIIDEQHRFGVVQRAELAAKGAAPDVLHMTATPIPRTLALTVYGGMDLTVIDELPPGRQPVKTRRIPPAKRAGMYDFIRREAEAGRQTYIVCPLVEESEDRDLAAAAAHFDTVRSGPLAGLRVDLLHGRMAAAEKESVMARFREGQVDVLVATSVIEVGVDAPAASVMVVEDAGNFGLTQLHQLRGRVGRGADQAYCFLMGRPRTPEARQRLDLLCRHASGFALAEADLAMRGPGEFAGVRQAGFADLRAADLVRDARLIEAARVDAEELLARDAELNLLENKGLRMLLEGVERPGMA
jgi:ATP-dependent DNA helicase RecG